MQRKRIKNLQAGDLAVIRSPYTLVTLNGHVKSDPSYLQYITGYCVDPVGDVKTFNIPYESVVILIDEMRPLVMHEGQILMVPKSCLWRVDGT
jgi:hypothetical protein